MFGTRGVGRTVVVVGSLFGCAQSVSAAQSITLTPLTNHPASTVTVSGTGFGAGKAIDLYWDTTDELLAVSDANGAFSKQPVSVPTSAVPGQHWITAVERDNGNAAQAVFTVRTDWAEHGFGAHGHRYNPWENVISSQNASNLDLAWSFATGGTIQSSPAVANGSVYVGSNDGSLYALNATTGSMKWSQPVGGVDYSSPAVANGVVYVGSMAGKVYALSASTGIVKWTYPASSALAHVVEGSPTVFNGVVYVGADDGNLYALNASTGAKLWQFTTTAGYQLWSAPALQNGTVYVGAGDDSVYAVNAATGNQVFKDGPIGSSVILSSPAIARGYVFIGTYDSQLIRVYDDLSRGTQGFGVGAEVLSSPAVANGLVYFGSADHYLYAVDQQLNLKWKYNDHDNPIHSSPALANGLVYFGCDQINGQGGLVTALNADTGALVWEQWTGGTVTSSPAVANGMVYVGSYDHKVYAFALDSGANAAYHGDSRPPSYSALHPNYRLKPVHRRG